MNKSKRKIFAVADCLERIFFFKRFKNIHGVIVENHIFTIAKIFIDKRVYKLRNCENYSEKLRMLKLRIAARADYDPKLHNDQKIFSIFWFLKTENPFQVILFNDSLKHNPLWFEICKEFKIRTYVLEISNFPGKMQISENGVNGNFMKIDHVGKTDFTVNEWIDKKKKYRPYRYIMYPRFWRPIVKLVKFLKTSERQEIIPKKGLDKKDHAMIEMLYNRKVKFFAQLSHDTNVKVHYRKNPNLLISTLQRNKQKFESLDIIYHPLSVERKNSLGKNETVYQIPKDAALATINSTVALEGVLIGLDVFTFGDSVLDKLDHKNPNSVCSYLNSGCIDIEYFANHPIPWGQ